ncbi:unnamed protein product [Lactuca saligna]|uniref:Uncharacterized protein n=1 Tax=Lactuca saligna TaxID=75948 RepID=A0AA35UTS0_LACSI|nr:unnamed protein product [Lactuca saligna]
MERMYNQRIMAEEWDLDIYPTIRKELKDNNITQRFLGVYPSGNQQFEVRFGNDAFDLDLIRRICECRSWQLRGKPKVKRTKDKSAFEGTGKKTHTISHAKGLQKCSNCRGIGYKKSSCLGKGRGITSGNGSTSGSGSGHVPVQEPRQEPVQEHVQELVEALVEAPVQDPVEAPVQAPRASRIRKMHVRKRKVSERITEIGLSKKFIPKGGIGCSQNKPVTLE